MYNSYGVSRISIKDDKMMSAFIKEFISFNVIDKDLLIKKNLDPIEFNKIEFNKIEKKNKDDIEQQDIELVPTEQP